MKYLNHILTSAILTLALLVSSSCSSTDSNDDGPASSVDGTWVSETVESPEENFVLTLNISQDGAEISGSAEIQFLEGRMSTDEFDIDGTYNAPDLQIDLDSEESFECMVPSSTSMQCDLGTIDSELLNAELARQ